MKTRSISEFPSLAFADAGRVVSNASTPADVKCLQAVKRLTTSTMVKERFLVQDSGRLYNSPY